MEDPAADAHTPTDAEVYSGLANSSHGVVGVVVARLTGSDGPITFMIDPDAARDLARMLTEAAGAADDHRAQATNPN